MSVEKFVKKDCINVVILRRTEKKDELTPTHIYCGEMKHNKKRLKQLIDKINS